MERSLVGEPPGIYWQFLSHVLPAARRAILTTTKACDIAKVVFLEASVGVNPLKSIPEVD